MARAIMAAEKRVGREIASMSTGFYGRGTAGEGYSGGYRDALADVLLLLNDVTPSRRDYWRGTDQP